ncbi:branched-chain amino acid ABC transporter permease [uncultured Paracoccus sp.]|uniref:branched-chain amino acid ABC transporter permease n=1 Tax=uncultured Paracoccus sp. TaxID=189685 RepID=UPI0025CCEAB3|nr:branched-chain amino acid ABC transporter permease [uncultured Paracoccus sp.]
MTNLLILQTLNGLQFGILLFLVAAGLTLVFGVMDVINLAHGAQYMLGAYLAAAFTALTGSFALGLLAALPVALAFGLLTERLVIRRLYDRSHLDQVLVTFGLMLMIGEGVRMIWGSAPISVNLPQVLSGSVPVYGNLRYPVYRLVILAAGLGAAGLLGWMIHRTRLGMLLRAGASNRDMVSALGTDINRLFLLVFGFGAMLAGFAGAMMLPLVSAEPQMGDTVLILTFVVIVIGGIGSIRGAFVAALLVGLVDTLGRSFGPVLLRTVMEPDAASQMGRVLAPMLIYILMALILAIRPAGLFPVRQ